MSTPLPVDDFIGRCDANMLTSLRLAFEAVENNDIVKMQHFRHAAAEWATCAAGLRAYSLRSES